MDSFQYAHVSILDVAVIVHDTGCLHSVHLYTPVNDCDFDLNARRCQPTGETAQTLCRVCASYAELFFLLCAYEVALAAATNRAEDDQEEAAVDCQARTVLVLRPLSSFWVFGPRFEVVVVGDEVEPESV